MEAYALTCHCEAALLTTDIRDAQAFLEHHEEKCGPPPAKPTVAAS